MRTPAATLLCVLAAMSAALAEDGLRFCDLNSLTDCLIEFRLDQTTDPTSFLGEYEDSVSHLSIRSLRSKPWFKPMVMI